MRKSFFIILLSLTFMALVTSCDKAPRYVIGESDMMELLVDIHQTEALIDMYPDKYASDSMKMLLKQSVFMKHHVTAEKFDTSMVWYSRNMSVYSDVYDRVIKRLEDSRKDLDVKSGKLIATAKKQRAAGRSYKDFGDTADLWTLGRQLVLTSNLGKRMLPYSIMGNSEMQLGDKYLLRLRSLNNGSNVKAFIGVEYIDGSLTFTERPAMKDGWNEFALQTDSLKKVRKVFGYIKFDVRSKRTICYVDSIMLLRVHLDRNSYDNINTQKVLDKNKDVNADKPVEMDMKAPEIKVEASPDEETKSADFTPMKRPRLSGGGSVKTNNALSRPSKRGK